MIRVPDFNRLSGVTSDYGYGGRLSSVPNRIDSGVTNSANQFVNSESRVVRKRAARCAPWDGALPAERPSQSGMPPYIQDLYRTALFTPEEEREAFRLLAKRRKEAHALRIAIEGETNCDLSAELKACEAAIVEIRNTIVEANLRLVVSVAKRFVGKGRPDLSELISEGNKVLLRAVDLFDPEYGARFSTYATTALQRAFMSTLKSSHRQGQRFTTGTPEAFESIEDVSAHVHSIDQVRLVHDAKILMKQLDDRERFIVEGRFGFAPGSKPKTFRELGETLGLSKERIRQILVKALAKLRQAADARRISLPEPPA